jgi:hypothetical protein
VKNPKWLYYARFQQPIPPGVNREPVSEFTLSGKQAKYLVDTMEYTSDGLVWTFQDETNITPLANVMYVRVKPS